jgi:hypothetical protein
MFRVAMVLLPTSSWSKIIEKKIMPTLLMCDDLKRGGKMKDIQNIKRK